MKSFFKYFTVIFITTVLTLSISSKASWEEPVGDNNNYINNRLLHRIVNMVREKYIEELSDEELYKKAINGLLGSLDPHSAFLDEKDYDEMKISTSGEFGGIGVEITMEKGVLKVISPIDDTPAYNAGIQAQDYIIKIDDVSVNGMGLEEAVSKIRGKKGHVVKLTVIRAEEDGTLDFFVKRDTIKIVSVKSEVKAGNIAYFRIISFSQETTANLQDHYIKLRNKMNGNIRGIVLDLRNNPGGLLDQSVSVSGLFLDKELVVSIKGRNDEDEILMESNSGEMAPNTPVVVLINGGSASASEIVAGALQYHKRAIVVGEKSFGKGSVQTIIPLGPSQVAMRLTTSLYYTPSGKSIQAEGIVPDVMVKQKKNVKTEVLDTERVSEADLPGHIKNGKVKDSKKEKEKLSDIYQSDYQLGRAIDLIYIYEIIKEQIKPIPVDNTL